LEDKFINDKKVWAHFKTKLRESSKDFEHKTKRRKPYKKIGIKLSIPG